MLKGWRIAIFFFIFSCESFLFCVTFFDIDALSYIFLLSRHPSFLRHATVLGGGGVSVVSFHVCCSDVFPVTYGTAVQKKNELYYGC